MDGKKSESARLRLDFKNPDHRKTVAHMLVDGYSHQEIAERFGYKYPSTLNVVLHREGGADSFLANTLGPDAVKKYRELVSEKRAEAGTRTADTLHEGDLISDVAHDPSVSPSEGLQDLGTHINPWYRTREMAKPFAPEKLSSHTIEKHRKAHLKIVERAARIGRHKDAVKAMIDSIITALREENYRGIAVPVFISKYTHESKALPSGKQEVLVMRVRRLTQTEAASAGDRGRVIDEFIGTLKAEVDRARNADSPLGMALRERGFDRVDFQITAGGQPIGLSSTHLR